MAPFFGHGAHERDDLHGFRNVHDGHAAGVPDPGFRHTAHAAEDYAGFYGVSRAEFFDGQEQIRSTPQADGISFHGGFLQLLFVQYYSMDKNKKTGASLSFIYIQLVNNININAYFSWQEAWANVFVGCDN